MQTQVDLSFIEAHIFHTIDVTCIMLISTLTLFTTNLPNELAFVLVSVCKVFLFMDGFCLIYIALIKFMSIFYPTVLNDYSEQKVRKYLRYFGLVCSILIEALEIIVDGENFEYIAYLTGKDLNPKPNVDVGTIIIYSLVGIAHFALLCAIEAQSYKYEDGILYLVIKNPNLIDFQNSQFLNRVMAFMVALLVGLFIIFMKYFDDVIPWITLTLPSIGYINPMILTQFFVVDLALLAMVLKWSTSKKILEQFKNYLY